MCIRREHDSQANPPRQGPAQRVFPSPNSQRFRAKSTRFEPPLRPLPAAPAPLGRGGVKAAFTNTDAPKGLCLATSVCTRDIFFRRRQLCATNRLTPRAAFISSTLRLSAKPTRSKLPARRHREGRFFFSVSSLHFFVRERRRQEEARLPRPTHLHQGSSHVVPQVRRMGVERQGNQIKPQRILRAVCKGADPRQCFWKYQTAGMQRGGGVWRACAASAREGSEARQRRAHPCSPRRRLGWSILGRSSGGASAPARRHAKPNAACPSSPTSPLFYSKERPSAEDLRCCRHKSTSTPSTTNSRKPTGDFLCRTAESSKGPPL